MSVSQKVKALLDLTGKNQVGLAAHLDISTQALYNKFNRDSWSSDDLLKVADFTGTELAFLIDEKQKISLDKSDQR